jgi:hypothetical protein
VAGGKRRGVWRVTTHTRRKGGDSFSYRLIFYIIAADEQNTHTQKAESAASFFPRFSEYLRLTRRDLGKK